jgi:hypothetical protein
MKAEWNQFLLRLQQREHGVQDDRRHCSGQRQKAHRYAHGERVTRAGIKEQASDEARKHSASAVLARTSAYRALITDRSACA